MHRVFWLYFSIWELFPFLLILTRSVIEFFFCYFILCAVVRSFMLFFFPFICCVYPKEKSQQLKIHWCHLVFDEWHFEYLFIWFCFVSDAIIQFHFSKRVCALLNEYTKNGKWNAIIALILRRERDIEFKMKNDSWINLCAGIRAFIWISEILMFWPG